jgi:hypothetical protein
MDTAPRKRTATPDRWALALLRAHGNGVQIFQVAGSGEWVATSTSKPGTCYRTDGVDCQCEAAMLGNDPVCVHRALYWEAQGVICLAGSHDPAPAPAASTIADVVTFLTPPADPRQVA